MLPNIPLYDQASIWNIVWIVNEAIAEGLRFIARNSTSTSIAYITQDLPIFPGMWICPGMMPILQSPGWN